MSYIDPKGLRILELEQFAREQEQRIGELEMLVRELMAQNLKLVERLESYSQIFFKHPPTL